eukprot:179419-Hanusia_phi.AAC.1
MNPDFNELGVCGFKSRSRLASQPPPTGTGLIPYWQYGPGLTGVLTSRRASVGALPGRGHRVSR